MQSISMSYTLCVRPQSNVITQSGSTLNKRFGFAVQLDRFNNAPAANWWEAPSWWEAGGPWANVDTHLFYIGPIPAFVMYFQPNYSFNK